MRTCNEDCSLQHHPVPGEGPTSAGIMLVGEAPGRHEDEEGRPFIGQAGKVLDRILQSCDMDRKSLRITNAVRCRPVEEGSNRRPTPIEVKSCYLNLVKEIALVNPRLVISLGEVSSSVLFGGARIGDVRGKVRCNGKRLYGATYHPAAVLRVPELEEVIVDDIQRFLRLLRDREQA